MSNYYNGWEQKDYHCSECAWSGKGSALQQGEMFDFGCELLCPKCQKKLYMIEFPTTEESRANWDKVSPADRAVVEGIELARTQFKERCLKSVDQLPEIGGEPFSLEWDLIGDDTVIRNGPDIIFQEPSGWENWERFIEVAKILKAKYGDRIKDLKPVPSTYMTLGGDHLLADRDLTVARREIFHCKARTTINRYPSYPKRWPLRGEPERQSQLTQAFARALYLHDQQKRKASGVRFISHLMAVAAITMEYGGDHEEVIAALLHDAFDDPDMGGGESTLFAIEDDFGSRVAEIVQGCSDLDALRNKPTWRQRKEAHIAQIRSASDSIRLVAAADTLHNARSMLADFRRLGTGLWAHFGGGREGTLWYYREIVSAFAMAGRTPLVDELDRVVTAIEAEVRAHEGVV